MSYDLSFFAPQPKTQKSREQLQRECLWCAERVATTCQCFEDCGKKVCPMDFEVYVPPAVPTFKKETQ